MEKLGSRSLLVTILKAVAFIVLFCLAAELIKSFVKELRILKSFRFVTLYAAMIGPFLVNEFILDLHAPYGKVQNFFFRNSFFSMLMPSLLILVAIAYLVLPKVMGGSFNKEAFVFAGGFISMVHMIFIARNTREHSFTGVINYAFMFSILFIVTALLFGLYLRVGYNFRLGKVIIDTFRDSGSLLRTLFMQIAR